MQYIITRRISTGSFDWNLDIIAVAKDPDDAQVKLKDYMDSYKRVNNRTLYNSDFQITPVSVGSTVFEFRY